MLTAIEILDITHYGNENASLIPFKGSQQDPLAFLSHNRLT